MITRQNTYITKRNNKVLITFVMPAIDNCACLYLVGKFSDWGESVYRMQRAEDGTWFLELELEPDCDYQYRYRTDKGDWYDDPAGIEPRYEQLRYTHLESIS
jgi:1,4-alpha-glucan branching enzyme